MLTDGSYRAQLLAALLQHPLVLVLPSGVPRLDLRSKQQVVLRILMTCGGSQHPITNIKTAWLFACIEVQTMSNTGTIVLPGHSRVPSLKEATVSREESMVVELPSNILPEINNSRFSSQRTDAAPGFGRLIIQAPPLPEDTIRHLYF